MSARVPGRAYRALLRLLPRDLRARHGEEMEALFREELARARDAGARGRSRHGSGRSGTSFGERRTSTGVGTGAATSEEGCP